MSKHVVTYTAITQNYDMSRPDEVLVLNEYNRFHSSRLNAKIYKILSHQWIDAEWSLWIDGNVRLKVPAEVFIDLSQGADIMAFHHPFRGCLYEEAEACKVRQLDDPAVIDAQVERYRQHGFPERAGLAECNILLRRHTPRVQQLNERWWAEICRGSVRDQISFPYVFIHDVRLLERELYPQPRYFTKIDHQNPFRGESPV